MRYSVILAAGLGIAAGASQADVPQVVTDIPPVHSLAARVMEGVGTPQLLIEGTASPHDFALTPAQAGALADADLVFWMGEALAPGLARSIDALSESAEIVALMEMEGAVTHEFREDAGEGHDHGHGHDEHAHDEHAHDEHAKDEHAHGDHAHDEHAHGEHVHVEHAHGEHAHNEHAHDEHGHDEHGHDEHGHDEHGHDDHAHGENAHDEHGHDEHAHGEHAEAHGHDEHGHDHSGLDPHGWLDPVNAILWTQAIAAHLAEADPANAAAYRANADAAEADLRALISEVEGVFAASPPIPFVVFHDAYQYFESRFGLAPVGAISVSSAEAPSAAQVALIRERLAGLGEVCVFAEPQFDPRIVTVVTEGTEARTAVIDPLGAELAPGAALYPALIRAMADRFATCG